MQVPVSTDDPIQSKKLFSSAGKGFDPRAKIIYLCVLEFVVWMEQLVYMDWAMDGPWVDRSSRGST